jgi:microcystin-dependent protein
VQRLTAVEVQAAATGAALEQLARPGAVWSFARNVVPDGWLNCDGQAVSRTGATAVLFAAIGTTFGVGDGSTTFNLPDLRGETIRGADAGRGVDPGRVFGSQQDDALQNITGTLNLGGGMRYAAGSGAFSVSSATGVAAATGGNSGTLSASFNASSVARTASETRGRNVAMLFCIKL